MGISLIKVGNLDIPTIDDLSFREKKLLVRVDINSPIDRQSGRILDDSRIKSHVKTVKELVEMGNTVVMLSHQGRPGDDDFVSLREHASLFSKHLGQEVKFIEDVIGPFAIETIGKLQRGSVALLENVRLVSEEIIESEAEKQSKTFLVKKLSPLFDGYINDAFATSHRSQPSLVGFPLVLPSAAGRLMEREVSALSKVFNPEDSPKIFVLGGGKLHDSIRIIENLSKQRMADRILLGGLVSVLFATAKGLNLGRENYQVLEKTGALPLIPRARKILLSGAPIEVPLDFKTIKEGKVVEESANRVEGSIKDIGDTTIDVYSSFMKDAKVITMRGPMGVIEDERFRNGTRRLLNTAMESKAFIIIGGGHMISMLGDSTEVDQSRIHVSTAGGALLLFLAGEKMPALEALNRGAKK